MTSPYESALAAVRDQQLARELQERLPEEAAEISINHIAMARQRHESWERRFGEVVRGWRQDRNWSQEDVAARLRHQGFDMHQTTVAKIERGTRPLRVAEATAIAEVFDMPIMAVFEVSLPSDHPGWLPKGWSQTIRDRHKALDIARRHSDHARGELYSAAKDHAYFLGEVEKLVLKMNQEAANTVRDESEA